MFRRILTVNNKSCECSKLMILDQQRRFKSTKTVDTHNNSNDDNNNQQAIKTFFTHLQIPKSRRHEFYKSTGLILDEELDDKAPIYLVSFHEDEQSTTKR